MKILNKNEWRNLFMTDLSDMEEKLYSEMGPLIYYEKTAPVESRYLFSLKCMSSLLVGPYEELEKILLPTYEHLIKHKNSFMVVTKKTPSKMFTKLMKEARRLGYRIFKYPLDDDIVTSMEYSELIEMQQPFIIIFQDLDLSVMETVTASIQLGMGRARGHNAHIEDETLKPFTIILEDLWALPQRAGRMVENLYCAKKFGFQTIGTIEALGQLTKFGKSTESAVFSGAEMKYIVPTDDPVTINYLFGIGVLDKNQVLEFLKIRDECLMFYHGGLFWQKLPIYTFDGSENKSVRDVDRIKLAVKMQIEEERAELKKKALHEMISEIEYNGDFDIENENDVDKTGKGMNELENDEAMEKFYELISLHPPGSEITQKELEALYELADRLEIGDIDPAFLTDKLVEDEPEWPEWLFEE